MTAIYLVDIVRDDVGTMEAYRFPDVLINDPTWVQLMIDTVRIKNGQVKTATSKKGLIVHPLNTVTATGILRVAAGTNAADLIAVLKGTAVTGQTRTTLRDYADTNGYPRFPEDSLWNALVAIIAEVEPAVNLEQSILSVG